MRPAPSLGPAVTPFLRPLAAAGALALLTELLVLRVLTRTAIHIPGLEEIAPLYRVVAGVGRLSFSLGVVLVSGLIVAIAIDRAASGRTALAVVLLFFLLVAGLAAAGFVSEVAMDAVTVLAVLATPFVAIGKRGDRQLLGWLAPTLLVAAFVFAGLPTIASKAVPELVVPIGSSWAVAEVLAVLAGVAFLVMVSVPVRRRSILVAVAVGGLVVAGLVRQPATIEILMLWNLGLAGYLPPVYYGLAAACVTLVVHSRWWRGDRALPIGVVFLAAGGIGLHSTIQSAAFLVGVVILFDQEVIRRSRGFEVSTVI